MSIFNEVEIKLASIKKASTTKIFDKYLTELKSNLDKAEQFVQKDKYSIVEILNKKTKLFATEIRFTISPDTSVVKNIVSKSSFYKYCVANDYKFWISLKFFMTHEARIVISDDGIISITH